MTTTLTRLPRPPAGRRARGERLLAAGAGLALLGLAIAVPLALVRYVGNPLPTTLPDRSWLDAQLSTGVVIKVLAVIVWLVWAHFLVCVATELVAARRGRVPGHVVAGAGSQLLARRLVATVLLLGGAATIAPALPIVQAPPAATASVVAGSTASTGSDAAAAAAARAADQAAEADQAARTVTSYQVHPPRGRNHDCLWDIAERTLGNPLRYKEIYELNRDRVQADGRRLVDKDLIQPGWVLVMPADARGPGISVHQAAASPTERPVERGVGQIPADRGQPVTDVAGVAGARPGEASAPVAPIALGGGLLLAGLLLLLSSRRGPFGQPEAGDRDLWLGADPGRADLIDRALRRLAADRRAQALPMPELLLAFVAADEVVLNLAQPAEHPPAPWTSDPAGRSWRLPGSDLAPGAPPDGTAAPYPALANLASTHGFEVLIDLEAAPGLVSLGGDVGVAREVAVSLCAELACAPWSDGVELTVVGFGEDLSALAPTSIRQVDHLAQVLDAVEQQAGQRQALLRSLGVDGVLTGRAAVGPDPWHPRVVLLSGPPTPEETERMQALVGHGRSPLAVICIGDSPAARWRFVVGTEGGIEFGVLGVEATARRLPREAYQQVVELVQAADRSRAQGTQVVGSSLPAGAAEALAIPAVDGRTMAGPPAVGVRLLGPVALETATGTGVAIDPDDPLAPLLTEVIVAAALHRDGLHEATLRASIWPRGVGDDVVEATLGRVREVLGPDRAGRPRLFAGPDGLIRLSPDVRTDWDVFRARVAAATGASEYATLRAALSLGARPGPNLAPDAPFGAPGGEVFSGLPADRYSWLAFHRNARDARALVTTVTRRAGMLAVGVGRPDEAVEVVRAGLAMVPDAEVLWRDLLKLLAGSDDPAPETVATQMYAALRRNGSLLPEPETDALVDALSPGFRDRSA